MTINNTTMTTEELLKPRYKVIADWPGNDFDVSEIIQLTNHDSDQYYLPDHEGYVENYESFFQSYPHLFRKLEWWEERRPDDMPEYVKDNTAIPKVIRKVDKHFWTERYSTPEFKDDLFTFISEKRTYNYFGHLPATIEDYNQYIKTKNK